MFYRMFYRFGVFFEPVPTSRVLLGEENEALLHLAGQSIDFWWFWVRFRLQFGALGLSFGQLFWHIGPCSVNLPMFFPRSFVTSIFTSIFSRFLSILRGGRHVWSIVNISKILVFILSTQDLKNDVSGVSFWRHFGALKLTICRQGGPWCRF